MALEFFGIDESETRELDLALAEGRARVKTAEAMLADARAKLVQRVKDREAAKEGEALVLDRLAAEADARVAEAEKALDGARRDLEAYVPGSGPVFIVGHIPSVKRAELEGERVDIFGATSAADSSKRDYEWGREVVRFAVRGHRGVRVRKGEIPFASEKLKVDGNDREVVAKATLEAYGPNLVRVVARHAWQEQFLEDAEKNA